MLARRWEEAVSGRSTDVPSCRLAKQMRKHAVRWLWFFTEPTTDSTKHRAERALRPSVTSRQVWAGNRAWQGAGAGKQRFSGDAP
jgi:hypothetical protein